MRFEEYDIVKNNGVNRIPIPVGPQMGLQIQSSQRPQTRR
uniref:Uncharacterized protein n=1 Tax=viral metagenome TaxID=1070528 RepID=A0A6C0M277_9ZZZZ